MGVTMGSSGEKRLPVSAGWKDRALKAEAEVERLRGAVEVAMRRYRDNKTHDREFVAELDAALHPEKETP